MSNKYFAIKVVQPMGEFYLTALPVKLLLKVGFTMPLRLKEDEQLDGNQRRLDPKRVKDIEGYLQSQDAVLPGTIILAANCTTDGEILDPNGDSANIRWRINNFAEDSNDSVYELEIPSDSDKLAAVVDGQHRLWGFENLSAETKEMLLPCAIFLDLPTPMQASVFATINFNQKPVSKSQSYELFSYNLEDEKESAWSPDKFAVFLTRKLNALDESPFKNHIKVAAQDDRVLAPTVRQCQKEWSVSTATVVEGILSLISKNPKEDRNKLYQHSSFGRSRKKVLSVGNTPPPFREMFISEERDIVIYKTILNFWNAVNEVFWKNISADSSSSIRKTAGIQALFRVLKELLPQQIEEMDFRQEIWQTILSPAAIIDFSISPFTESSGKGRSYIQDAILVAIGKKDIEDVRDDILKKHLKEKLGGK